ncbi:MAG: hypothetical protein U0175_17395 [Caldilineaceae bacterium]
MKRRLVAIHLVCRGGRGVRWVDSETFITGGWVISQMHIHEGVILALHESKVQASYLQGKVLDTHSTTKEITNSGRHQQRLDLLVKVTATPLAWQGRGSGEKGLVWSE